MKGLKAVLGIALSVSGLGTAVALGTVSVAPTNEIAQVEAATYAYDVYVDIQGAHSDYDAGNVYCHNWDGGTGTTWPGTKMTQVEGTLYGVNINANNKKCIFNAGDGKNQTANLTINSHKVYLLNTSEWTDINHYRDTSSQTPSANTTRVFINNSNVGTNWNSSSAQTMIRAWGSASYSFDATIYQLNWFQNDGTGASGKWYGYADIPSDVTGWQAVRINPNVYRRIWNYGPEGSVASGGSARVYQLKESGWNFSWDTTTSDSAVGASFGERIIAAYSTCSNSGLNGYGAYTQLNSNFFSHLTNDAKSHSCKSLGGIANYTIQQHVDGMANLSGHGSGSNTIIPNMSNNGVVVVGVIVLTLVSSTGLFFFIRKRRYNQ